MGARIVDLARAERAAEESRGRADAAWRAAWWDLTLALAAVEDRGTDVRDAADDAAHELGQARETMYRRRRIGLQVDHASMQASVIHRVRPGLARYWLEMSGDGSITAEVAEQLIAREEGSEHATGRGVVKELVEELAARRGKPVPIEYRTREGDRTPAERTAIVHQEMREHPDVVARVIEQHPEVARGIARQLAERPAARQQLDDARQDVARERLAAAGVTGPPPRDETSNLLIARGELAKATTAVRTAFERVVELDLDDAARAALAGDTQRLTQWVALINDRVASGSFDDELRTLLEAEA